MAMLLRVFETLMNLYGPQGWWPLGASTRYHKGEYDRPSTPAAVFEVYVGAILTQNSTWNGAREAMLRLRKHKAMNPRAILALPLDVLEEAVRPARYLRQKAGYLREVAAFFLAQKARIPTREELLAVRGIGRETADSILLYAHHQPIFVVDTYTRRVLTALGLIAGDEDYDMIREMFEHELPRDKVIFNEYHALLVEHARKYYSKQPYGVADPLPEMVGARRAPWKDIE